MSRSWDMQEQRWTMRSTSRGSSHTSRPQRRIWSNNCRSSVPYVPMYLANMTKTRDSSNYGNTAKKLSKAEKSPIEFSIWHCHPASSPLYLNTWSETHILRMELQESLYGIPMSGLRQMANINVLGWEAFRKGSGQFPGIAKVIGAKLERRGDFPYRSLSWKGDGEEYPNSEIW